MSTTSDDTIAGFIRAPINGDLAQPDCVEHCNRFKYWLQDKNVGIGSLNNIVEAIAEKTETWIPGIYSADAFPEEV
ncbi:conserved unknown protein [Ectocarpus siliculosus]|uniref:Uncharacterized protein n=1 Tax=Ectocarpus siliculosus TaxID=2880 RepID=D7FY52_ECTSI|nr:conserved unknown protein [Ectocarpus siliculosus]|eukprot:CBJ26491.1 conserved unknown protein [Ectocarpus siliculosus]